jgi:dTMP kinase
VAGGLGAEIVQEIGKVATGGLQPSLTIVIDVNEKKWLHRKGFQRDGAQVGLFEEPPDREELKGLEFHKKVRDAYLVLASDDDLSVVVDGSGTPEQVHEKIVKVVENALR